jgi:hypothetical protein
MINFSGVRGSYFLFTDGNMAVVVDSTTNMVDEVGHFSALSHIQPWEKPTTEAPAVVLELASGALADLSISTITASGRMYTIPKAAQEEAKRGLEWRKEHNRGGTPVGVNSARILANGGQIGLKKVRHIAKYFPRHEVDKRGKGYKPGDDGFPSSGRIAWALWGGDAAWRWAQQIVERENKKGMRADGYYADEDYSDYEIKQDYLADLGAFKLARELNDSEAPEFVARVRMDHGAIDRLYMVDLSGKVHVWDEAGWDDLGHVDSDISTYDKSLDDPYDRVEKVHIPIDPESALILSACFQENPHKAIGVYDLYPDEAELASLALSEIDWTIPDMSIIAAGEIPGGEVPDGAVDPTDQVYTPKERSANAKKQVRDRGGKFSQMGSRVAIGGDISNQGNITSIDRATQSVVVKMDSGESIRVPGVQTQAVEDVAPPPSTSAPTEGSPLDTSGILAMPRTPMTSPDARIPGTLPALTSDQLQQVMYNYPAWVKEQRDIGLAETYTPPKPKTDADVDKYAESYMREREKISGTKELKGDLREHPLFKDVFKKKPIYNLYYNPKSFMASAEQKKTIKEVVEETGMKDKGVGKKLTPETSDVQPMYMAIVSPDDPSAVFDLISLVPAGTNSTQPSIFKRVDKKWVADQKILNDLTSPTPPPVVPLHGDDFLDVLSQVDGTTTASAFIALTAAGVIVAEERDLAEALTEIADKYGKFNEDETGIWAGYMPADENKYKDIGVTCANCVLYQGGTDCRIIAASVEPLGKCRFAVIPDGVVKMTASASEFAQGGIDKNRGNAEKLRRYWVYGRGAAKIKWGLPGDWSRCVRHLGKYMGPRAKGYCNLRHKDALKIYPATHAKILHGGKRNSNDEFIAEPVYEIFGGNPGRPKLVINAKDFDNNKKRTKKYASAEEAVDGFNEEYAELVDVDNVYEFTPTVVTDEDMDMSFDQLMALTDDNFDESFVPDEEILAIISEASEETILSSALVAVGVEGGLDRNRGNAEKLRRYWTIGRGGLKIRWNTPGDWTRCYRQLMKYMGPRAKGYCSLRHKEMTGVWPGSKYNIGKKNKNIIGSGDAIRDEQEIFEMLFAQAGMQEAKNRVLMASIDAPSYGAKFKIPLVIPEEVESGDGRKFKKDAISVRELPLPLLWQIKTADGHSGSVVVGRIDHMERVDGGIGNAHGVFDTSAYGKEAERMVRDGFIRGVSADLDKFEASEDAKDEAGDDTDEMKAKKIGGDKITITKSRVMAVTIVPKPAFEECKIYLDDTVELESVQEEPMENLPDGVYIEDGDGVASIEAAALLACGMIAGAIPTVPPSQWFTNPELSGPTPLTVDDDGRVFGHIASWQTDHIGMRSGTRAPKSRTDYAYFHTGVVRADDGKDYTVGQLTLAGGHASLEASALEAARHYDDTGSAIADVHAGEDKFGIWVAGALRPSASPEQIRALRASAPSGDWRPINGALELVAVCQVNVPGFPVARARVASGQIYALVAAGAASLAHLKEDPMQELAARIDRLEKRQAANPELVAKAEELSNKLRSSFDYDTFGYMSRQMREKLASEGKALPDGSYPIRNEEDLKNAIQAYGRSKPGKRAAVRRHIIKKARALGKSELVPEQWKTAGLIDEEVVTDIQARVAAAKSTAESTKADNAQKIEELRARVASAKEGLLAALPMEPTEASEVKANPEAVSTRGNKYISGVNQPRDQKGKFRDVLARLKQDLGDSGLQNVMDKIEETDALVNAGNYDDAAAGAASLLELIARLDSGALDATSLENVREAAKLLGTVISNLPLPFSEQTQKVRFSDLPPVLRDLIDDMITKVEAKIGKEDADEATQSLRSYKSGSDVYSQGEVSSEMSKLLRLLT